MKSQMAQPSVRVPAMAAKNQQQVWDQVATARKAAESMVGAAVGGIMGGTTSYAKVMAAPQVQQRVDTVAADYNSMLDQLKKTGAKGVVVAINGNIVWTDLFASNDLLLRYWQKLVRSYAAESLTREGIKSEVDQAAAQAFLDRVSGNHEVVETDPGVFRRAEVTGDSYKVFTLTSLLPKTNFAVHTAKMRYEQDARLEFPRSYMVR
jgi:hypothetical protein